MGEIDLNELADEIMEVITDGIDDITADCLELAKQTAEECRDALAKSSPSDSGDYAKGWTVKKSGNEYIVYNKNKPNIEMPLEHGHIAIKGKHAGQRVGKRPHIYRIADRYRNMFYNVCQRRVGK